MRKWLIWKRNKYKYIQYNNEIMVKIIANEKLMRKWKYNVIIMVMKNENEDEI